jgi:hypothetical protein
MESVVTDLNPVAEPFNKLVRRSLVDSFLDLLYLFLSEICCAESTTVRAQVMLDPVERVSLAKEEQGGATWLQIFADLFAEFLEVVASAALSQFADVGANSGARDETKHWYQEDGPGENTNCGAADGSASNRMAFSMVFNLAVGIFLDDCRVENFEVAGLGEALRGFVGRLRSSDIGINKCEQSCHCKSPFLRHRTGLSVQP